MRDSERVVSEADLGEGEVELVRGAVGFGRRGARVSSLDGKVILGMWETCASASGMDRIGRFVVVMVQPSSAIWRCPRDGSSCRRCRGIPVSQLVESVCTVVFQRVCPSESGWPS